MLSETNVKNDSEEEMVTRGLASFWFMKKGGATEVSYDMHGKLYLSATGWLLLSVPNDLARGVFNTLSAPGIELPTDIEGKFNAHISVMKSEEIESVGGPNRITERGHDFSYRITNFKTVEPKTWEGVSKVWMLEVKSPELEQLRKSYGLTPLPNEDHQFHITVAIRKKHVLRNNDITKTSSTLDDMRQQLDRILSTEKTTPASQQRCHTALANIYQTLFE